MTERLTLTELQLIIKDSLYMALPDFYWVIAEISEIKANTSGHCYLELIDKPADEKHVRARIKAVIWNNRYRFLKALFESSTGESLREGMKILVKTKVEYHELYGLSLVISDIDPAFTIGEMALKRQMVIRKLEEEGVFSMNRELEFPMVPRRIAVISSGKAAGYGDFMNHLTGNSFGYIFYTALFETAMQGTETEESVISSLNRIADHADLFDVVVIIRGGGSQTDLSWFDNYNIAYHVTQFPIPVLTGIGHEKDLSVTDMVAFKPLKTPTATADYLIECFANAESRLNEISTGIMENTRQILEEWSRMVESFLSNLNLATRLMSDSNRKTVERFRSDLVSFTYNFLKRIKNICGVHENTLAILNPENVLRRGYTITSLNGKIVKSIRQVAGDDVINTQFSDGKVTSKVIEKTKDKRLKKQE